MHRIGPYRIDCRSGTWYLNRGGQTVYSADARWKCIKTAKWLLRGKKAAGKESQPAASEFALNTSKMVRDTDE
jgi:hypothetical protein